MNPQPPKELYLTFAGGIDQLAVSRIFNGLNGAVNQGVEQVHLLIQSAGGNVEDGLAVHNYLTNLPLELTTYNEGAVQSIAVLMYLSGKIRKCAGNACFLMHKTTFTFMTPVDTDTMRGRANITENCDKVTDAILRKHITMPDDRWALRDKSAIVLSAEEAKKFGLVHEIEHFTPPHGFQVFNL
jgi:ATP-dependent Clp protease protease subunit